MSEVDAYLPDPVRATDKPFMLAIEAVHNVPGKGTVATGLVEAGVVKPDDKIEIVGYKKGASKAQVRVLTTFYV